MAKQVVMGALLRCSEGVSPCPLIVIPHTVNAGYPPAAHIQDYKPIVNIPTFGMCNSSSNPAVIAATAAASGTKTPAPCIPATTSAWSSGSPSVKIDSEKALTDECTCDCMWNGTIEVSDAGQGTVKIEA
jgi:hypothetical protein